MRISINILPSLDGSCFGSNMPEYIVFPDMVCIKILRGPDIGSFGHNSIVNSPFEGLG